MKRIKTLKIDCSVCPSVSQCVWCSKDEHPIEIDIGRLIIHGLIDYATPSAVQWGVAMEING